MTDFVIDEKNARRLEEIAKRENRTVNEVLNSLLDEKYSELRDSNEVLSSLLDEKYGEPRDSNEVLRFMDGMFDDDITDLSSITKDDVMAAYRKKYADPD